MNPIFEAAHTLEVFCHQTGWKFCFIGGLAVQRWGEPRLTQDVGATILTGFDKEAEFVDALLGRFRGRLPDAREFALRNRVLLLQSEAGVPIDVALGAMPYEERAIERASPCYVSDCVAITLCGAEDLIIFKTFAGREKDWLDLRGIVLRQSGRLDETLIWSELEPLLALKEDVESGPRLRRLLADLGD